MLSRRRVAQVASLLLDPPVGGRFWVGLLATIVGVGIAVGILFAFVGAALVTWGALVQRSLLAAQLAEKAGISAAVIDLRSIMPYDWDAIANAVKHTSRVIVAHEDQLTCGFGAEIAARISEELFELLDAPVTRVAAMDTPVAYAPELEQVILPQTDDILKAIEKVAAY